MDIDVAYFFFFNDTATTEIYTLSLHDALPILADELKSLLRARATRLDPDLGEGSLGVGVVEGLLQLRVEARHHGVGRGARDRKSTRLNSSHANISYAVFCLKKKMTSI